MSEKFQSARMNGGIGTYIKQAFIVMRNEAVKFLRGKKLLIFTILIALVLMLITFLPYALGEELPASSMDLLSIYVSFVPTIILLFATLFSSTSLVSEFEERTALILFTRPVKKSSILLGKFMASLAIGVLYIGAYYAVACTVSMIIAGGIDSAVLTSFALALLYLFCMIGIALTISSLVKKGSTAAILTFVLSLLIFQIISSTLAVYDIANWWLPNQASNSILTVFDGNNSYYYGAVDASLSAEVLGIWGIVTTAMSYIFFRRRDF